MVAATPTWANGIVALHVGMFGVLAEFWRTLHVMK